MQGGYLSLFWVYVYFEFKNSVFFFTIKFWCCEKPVNLDCHKAARTLVFLFLKSYHKHRDIQQGGGGMVMWTCLSRLLLSMKPYLGLQVYEAVLAVTCRIPLASDFHFKTFAHLIVKTDCTEGFDGVSDMCWTGLKTFSCTWVIPIVVGQTWSCSSIAALQRIISSLPVFLFYFIIYYLFYFFIFLYFFI